MDNNVLLNKIERFKKDGFEYQKRRHEDWKENYQLYRDKVITNRITQRQSVNVPIMKETLKTWLVNIDDAPDLTFEELDNDKQKEIFINEYWKHCAEINNLEIKDIMDKKQVGLYGRSFKKLNISDGEFYFEILDPMDVIIDRYADPADIDGTAQCIIHQHIFRTLGELERNENYDKEVINQLKTFYSTTEGMIKSSENTDSLRAKNERMASLGDTAVEDPQVGETYVELNENYIKLWDGKEFKIHLVITTDGKMLMNKPLDEILNINFYPFVSWADDIDRTDIWSDGLADTVRTPNKVLNVWFSQLVENRTLRNFGMNYYNSTDQSFTPQTFTPLPFGWYPVPGNPNDLVKRIDIPELSESLDEMQFVINAIEKSTATTGAIKGETEQSQTTLGEIQITSQKAMERITSTAKFYRVAWKEFGDKWVKIVDANADKLNDVKLYKKSYKNNYFGADITPTDWKSEAGYTCLVRTTSEQEKDTMDTLQKFNAVMAQFPTNAPLREIYQKKLLDLIKLSPEEIQEVVDFEKQAMMSAQPMEMPMLNQPQMVEQPL